jgi:membrane protein implicated in regulation of membrane protease activity
METFFLACFVFGALFTVASIVLGAAGHGVGHLTQGHGASQQLTPHGGGHAAHAGHNASAAHGPGHQSHALPLWNFSSVVGALTWFGAVGYLLLSLGDLAPLAVILGAVLAGVIGWYLIARFLGLVLRGESELDPEDYRLDGTLGTISVPIPAGGTGEIVFSKADVRRGEAARALDGQAIPRGSEVVIVSYEHGFATVQPWSEYLAARERIAAQNQEAEPQS